MSRRFRHEISDRLRAWLERVAADQSPLRREREREAARQALLTPRGAVAERTAALDELIHEYDLDKSMEDADRPISQRLGRDTRRLSARFMAHLERTLELAPRERRLELRAASGWHPTSADKIYVLHQNGRCSTAAEKPKVRALAALLGFRGDPFDLEGEVDSGV